MLEYEKCYTLRIVTFQWLHLHQNFWAVILFAQLTQRGQGSPSPLCLSTAGLSMMQQLRITPSQVQLSTRRRTLTVEKTLDERCRSSLQRMAVGFCESPRCRLPDAVWLRFTSPCVCLAKAGICGCRAQRCTSI